MNLSLLREYTSAADKIGSSLHLWPTLYFSISNVEKQSFIWKANLFTTLCARELYVVILGRRFDTAKYHNLLAGYLKGPWVYQLQLVVLWNVINSLPLIFLDFENLNLGDKVETLIFVHLFDRWGLGKNLTPKSEDVLIVELAHTKALSWVIHFWHLLPGIIFDWVNLAALLRFDLGLRGAEAHASEHVNLPFEIQNGVVCASGFHSLKGYESKSVVV